MKYDSNLSCVCVLYCDEPFCDSTKKDSKGIKYDI